MSRQGKATGGRVGVTLKAITAGEVIRKRNLSIVRVPLVDWLVCSKCNHQQLHHSGNGGDFERTCWKCGADHYHFVYFDELARSVDPQEKLFRFVR